MWEISLRSKPLGSFPCYGSLRFNSSEMGLVSYDVVDCLERLTPGADQHRERLAVVHMAQCRSQLLENYILQSNGIHKILQKYKHIKCIKQERHRYTWFTQFGLRPQRNSQYFLLYYPTN